MLPLTKMTSTSTYMSHFTPLSPARIVRTTTKHVPAVARGHEWWTGNATHGASAKVNLVATDLYPQNQHSNIHSATINGVPLEGKWRRLRRGWPHTDAVLVRDFRGIVKEIKDIGENRVAERLRVGLGMPIGNIYHQRDAVIPAYDEITTHYEEEGWTDARVYYYGLKAEIRTEVWPDGYMHSVRSDTTLLLSYTHSPLTPTRAVSIVGGLHSPSGVSIPYTNYREFVVDGKVVHKFNKEDSAYEDMVYESEWRRGMPLKEARAIRHWSVEVSPMFAHPRTTGGQFTLAHGGLLMGDISSKNITDTQMNPFGEGHIVKNRVALTDGLSYLTEGNEGVPQVAMGIAKANYLFKKEVMEAALHPDRVAKMVEKYGIDWVDE